MSSKKDYSKKILRILSEKPAISLAELHNLGVELPSDRYALSRSLKGLREAGLIENISSPQNEYARLTKEGRKKINMMKLDNDISLVNTSWDGFWRIILLDLPENRKSERESLRYLLKKAGFVCLKNSAWISPYPYEYLFTNIKKDLGLTTEMIIFTTNNIDEISKRIFFENFNK